MNMVVMASWAAPAPAPSLDKLKPGGYYIDVQGEQASISARDASLKAILSTLNDLVGNKLEYAKIPERTITIKFSNIRIPELLARLRVNYALLYRLDPTTKRTILEAGGTVSAPSDNPVLTLEQMLVNMVQSFTNANPDHLGNIYPTPFPVSVTADGDLSDWPADVVWHGITSTNGVAILDDPYARWKNDTIPESNADASFRVATVADCENLYVALEVFDDVKVVNQSDDDELLFLDDSVEVYIDGGNEKSTSYDENDSQITISRTEYPEDEPRISPWKTFGRGIPGNETGTRTKVTDTETGYIVEAEIPLATFGIIPKDETLIGFNTHVNDDDDGGSRDHKLIWSELERDHEEGSYHNPSAFGELLFKDIRGDGTRCE